MTDDDYCQIAHRAYYNEYISMKRPFGNERYEGLKSISSSLSISFHFKSLIHFFYVSKGTDDFIVSHRIKYSLTGITIILDFSNRAPSSIMISNLGDMEGSDLHYNALILSFKHTLSANRYKLNSLYII